MLSLHFRQYDGLVPVVGTVLIVSKVGLPSSTGDLLHLRQIVVVLGCVIDVGAQVAGIAILLVGLFSPSRWLERDVAKPSVTFVPGAAGAPVGASLVGRF